jgi:hypothetical protein
MPAMTRATAHQAKQTAPTGTSMTSLTTSGKLTPDEEVKSVHDEVAGNLALGAAMNAALIADRFHLLKGEAIDRNGGVSLGALSSKIERMAQAVNAGNMAEVEMMLLGQAVALQTIFVQYSIRSASEATQDRASELLLLALKAQAASRATLTALAEVRFPKSIVVTKQANIAQGAQQVNNGPAAPTGAGAGIPPAPQAQALPAPQEPLLVLPAVSARAHTRKSADRTVKVRR